MSLLNNLLNKGFAIHLNNRLKEIEHFKKNPFSVQEKVLQYLISKGQKTVFGKDHGLNQVQCYEDFKQQVPIYDYPRFRYYIDRMLEGEQGISWPTPVHWFSMSSGTTGGRSKYIPVSPESLKGCHFKAGKDLYAIYYHLNPNAKVITGKNLVLGGSHQINQLNASARYGDISAVLMQNTPAWARLKRAPDIQTALMEDWEAKIDRIARETMQQNITSLLGVPTWTVVLIEKIFEITGKDNLADIWPNLELYIHGGVSFEPYRELFNQLIRKNGMHYLETYNASEGFFGIQDQMASNELLLMLNYGIFFEFIPISSSGDDEEENAIPVWEVEKDRQYAIVITTNGGLWRYKIGDTLRFTSLDPLRFRLTGRTQHFINTFGEEVIVENAESAIAKACEATGSIVAEYTVGPVYFSRENKKGGHEWIIEFEKAPDNLRQFQEKLDEALKKENSDYAAKRFKNMALLPPVIDQMEAGTFYKWMKARNKLGGQNKVPRLANHRENLDDLLQFASAINSVQ